MSNIHTFEQAFAVSFPVEAAEWVLDRISGLYGDELLKKLFQKFDIKLKKVFNINVADEVIVGRAVQRMVCSGCFSVYNKITTPPKKEGACDFCGTSLSVRADDDEETVRNRSKVYHNAAGVIISSFRNDKILVEIDGSLSDDKVWGSISSYL